MLVRYRLCMGITAVAVLLAITGCGKKNESETQSSSYSDMPQLESSAPTKDSVDIFDEFYDGETEESSSLSSSEETTEAVDNYSSAAVPNYTPSFAPDGRYVVQVSTVASYAVGEDVKRKFDNMGYPAYLAEVQNPTADLIGTYYRLRIGGFNTISAANEFGNNALVPKGFDYWVDYRSNDNVGMGGYGLGESSTSDYQDSYNSGSSYDEQPSYESQSDYGSSTDSYESAGSGDDWGSSETTTPAATQNTDTQTSTPQTEAVSTPPQTESTTETAPDTQPATPNNPATDDSWSEEEWGDDDWSSESSW